MNEMSLGSHECNKPNNDHVKEQEVASLLSVIRLTQKVIYAWVFCKTHSA